ncbi:probable insulin-like peptide 1 [Drosophila innubila]|uniref:probable insulin-like peptide 1 n=1 Tax=Drosophila innubila TaxID=198719 RepID=UPI00148E8CAB|nr:probable insulin-like peptide 1 [Drosophila innubila]
MGWCCVTCNAGSISSAQQLRQGSHKLCGQELNKAVEMACESGGYNTLQKKRTDGIDTIDTIDTSASAELALQKDPAHASAFQLSPILSSIYGTEVLIKTRRMRRQMTSGIYEECCVNSCNYFELLAYCRQK